MKIKTLFIMALVCGIVLSLVFPTVLAAQEQEQDQEQERTAVIIPQQVKTVFQEGMATRQSRMDIPFQISDTLYLPAQQNLHVVFFFTAKNADLGFAPAMPTGQEAQEAQEAEEEEPAVETLVAQNYTFLQFNKLVNDAPGEMVKEIYIPMNVQVDSSSYEPEKEETYTTGYPLPPGDYLLSMAITSQDFQKIGTQYYELSLPDPLSYTDTLETTPIFFVDTIEQLAAPETQAEIHKDFFRYSILQIERKEERVFAPEEYLDIFFFIFGAQADEQGQTDIEISFQVYQAEELIIKFQPQKYPTPLVSQKLPMKKTVLIRTTKGTETTEKTEKRDLEPGNFILTIDIKDNISGKTVKKSVDFEIR